MYDHRKIFSAVCSCLLSAVALYASEAALQAKLEPASVLEGESFMLSLSYDGRETPELQELPKGFVYQGSSQSTQIINGHRTSSVGYQFAAPSPGNYTLPPLKVKLGKQTVQTPELKLQVVKDQVGNTTADAVTAELLMNDQRKTFFVGEEIPISVNIYYPLKMRLQVAYPQLDIGKSLFRDYRRVNPENPSFAPPQQRRRMKDDKLMDEISFVTAIRPLAPGMLQIKGVVDCQILIPGKRRQQDPFDGFFGGGVSYRKVARQLKMQLPEITVKPLPEVPDKGLFLGLVGNYDMQVKLSENKLIALEPVSLDLYINSPNSSLETLRVPEVVLKNCRVYPGEVRQTNGGCAVSYAIIPLKAGTLKIDLDFLIFDPVSQQYRAAELVKTLEVAPPPEGKKTTMPPSAVSMSDKSTPEVNTAADNELGDQPHTTLLYCKKAPESAWTHFYRSNRMILVWILLIAGPLWWLLKYWGGKLLALRSDDPDSIRRERAGAMRGALQTQLRQAQVEDLPRLATGEISNYLCDRWKMPAGSTIEELANQAQDPVLGAVLRECAEASYLPPALVKSAIKDPGHVREVLLKALKCIAFTVLLFAVPAASASEKKSWSEALRSYDRGEYAKSKAYFTEYHHNNPVDANVLYNLGCIAEANGEQEMALWYLESAGLLAPGDSAIAENRNVMRRKFFLPPVGQAHTPQELLGSLRDRLHPEDYFLIAAICWFLGFVLISVRRRLPENYSWAIGIVLLASAILSVTAGICQQKTVYDRSQALVVAKNAKLFTFPGKHNGQSAGNLAGGTPVKIVDQQGDYALVRTRDMEGWTENKNIRPVLE